jgi:DNA-binding transcriptional ArsR family regulator
MRPIATKHGFLQAPLNLVLGAEANVRVLRSLFRTSEPCSLPSLASSSGLSHTGISKVLEGLTDLGIIIPLGTGRSRLFRLRDSHPLHGALKALFETESEWKTRLEGAIQKVFAQLENPPISAWIEGSSVVGNDLPGDPIRIGILASVKQQRSLNDVLEPLIGKIERDCDVPIDLIFLSEADIEPMAEDDPERFTKIRLLFGSPPMAFVNQNSPTRKRGMPLSHEKVDQRNLRLGELLANEINKDSSLITKAREFIARRMKEASPNEQRTLREWERILTSRSTVNIMRLLRDPGERATRLRQSLPFVGAIAEALRKQLRESSQHGEESADEAK